MPTAKHPSRFRLAPDVRPTDYHLHLEPDLDAGASAGEVRIDARLARPRAEIVLHCEPSWRSSAPTAEVERPGDAAARAARPARRDGLAARVPAAAGRRRHAPPALRGRAQPPPARALRRQRGRRALRLHAARGGRRAPLLPVLRRAGDEGALPRRGDDARRRDTRALERADRARAGAAPTDDAWSTSRPRRRSRPTWSRSRSARSRRAERASRRARRRSASGTCRARRTSRRSRSRPAPRRSRGSRTYFGLPYPYGKLDLVAVPDFEAGAMENAGAVFFRETLLLLDPATVSLAEKKRAAEVIAHELAHMWYGDLVTMAWWDDLWLNEAFATWMAFHVVDEWKPEWRMWHDFEHDRAAALGLDALANTHPIYAAVRSVAAGDRELRRHHLREGRGGGAHDRALPRRRRLPRRRAALHPAPPRGQRGRGRSVARARGGVGRRRSRGSRRPGSSSPASRW